MIIAVIFTLLLFSDAMPDIERGEPGPLGCRRVSHQLAYLLQEIKSFRNEQAELHRLGLFGTSGSGSSLSLEDDYFRTIDSKFDMITAYTRFKFPTYQRGDSGIANKVEGSKFYYGTSKTRFIFNELRHGALSSSFPIRTICEIGFNAGHSATLFLDSLPEATLIEFDLGDFGWAQQNSDMLKFVYGPRFVYIKGDSAKTIAEFAKNGTKCDVTFIDGVKGESGRRNDVLNIAKISHRGTYVFGDEANTVECMSGEVDRSHPKCLEGPHGDTSFAWNSLVREGYLEYVACSPQAGSLADIVCLW
eukprot:CAMPEP_0202889618 /NCGR_PEP_ID=MMETSP1392-20130828/204_1 /ASSEMBLY_ACC=CAM_ASM_000868 /TAXON_ID=225041 /ORGANISM="Chlamydomonas chlamydogama, Strain SAG 11-48b" /LENGTH=303 /DNA_ID=CAMNT_0049572993 /DNA_START=29 /DNA_END=937 /DNA_ORIENTATION=+